jgi:hypothetical protein
MDIEDIRRGAIAEIYRKSNRELAAEVDDLRGLLREMGKATTELLAGHDQLYDAFFHYLPDRNPLNDLAAKDAREILSRPEVREIMEAKP